MTYLQSRRMAAWALAAAVLAPAAVGAVVPKQGDDPLAALAFVSERLAPRPEVEAAQDVESMVRPEIREALAALRGGGEWAAYVDKRTGLLEAAAGAGIPWIPGRGNQLTQDDVASYLQGGGEVDLAALERIARSFLPRVAPMLGVKPANLRLNQERSGQVADYLWHVDFDVVRGGLPVDGAHVTFTVNHGNLIQIEAESLPAPGSVVPATKVNRKQALATVARYLGGFGAADWFVDGGSLHLVPVAVEDARFAEGYEPGRGRGIAAVWQFTFLRDGSAGTWRARVDASNGRLLELVDVNDYAHAYVRGGVMFGGAQTTRPMPSADITVPPGSTNSAGVYDYTGGVVHSTLNGPFVRILDSCGPIDQTSDPSGNIDFGLSPANNCSTPGSGGLGNTRSARTQFFHLNRAKETARGWYPANAWLNAKLTANVNINLTCNAFWNGSTVNFYRSGGGCGNTGEIEEVSLHEYGHGFDQNDGNGSSVDKGTGETYGDFTAALVSHTSCIGDGFFTSGANCSGYGDPCLNCTGVRDIDWGAHLSNTPHTVANFTQIRCNTNPSYQGPCGREGHCESLISSEAVWDLAARDLPSPGSAAAWAVTDRLWYLSRPTATKGFVCVTTTNPWTSHGCAAGTYWRALRAVDDDDGNLANGTPNGGALFAAFNRHLIACTTDAGASVTFAGCTPPATPTVTLVPGDDQVTVSWTSSGAGVVYDVYRNDLGCGFGSAKVANDVAGTSWVDTGVADDVTYSYMVVAHASGNEACSAVASACQNVTPRHRTDIWSKDLPADVGLEPDPALFGQPMWQSPDIWVRNNTTPGPHQNPEYGQVNYVHVNVRNRSTVTAINAPVKVYYANASVGLSWPADWTLIGTATIASLAPGATTEITPLPWSPPTTGHFCLLSRIDTPQDPMTFAETTNVDYNTRYNNNIVWKNVNVVDLVANPVVKVTFIFRNPDRLARRSRLLFRPPVAVAQPADPAEKGLSAAVPGDVGDPFLQRGRVVMALPDKLVALMEEQGVKPERLKQIDRNTYEMVDGEAGFLEVKLEGREEFTVELVFENTVEANPTTDDAVETVTYNLEVVEEDADNNEEVGGIAYLITAPKI
jgi:hypothetical protein